MCPVVDLCENNNPKRNYVREERMSKGKGKERRSRKNKHINE